MCIRDRDTGHGVTDAGQGVLVGHIIGDGGLRIRDDVLVPIEAVGGRGGDARHMGGRGLLAVLDVGVGHKLDAVLLKACLLYTSSPRCPAA